MEHLLQQLLLNILKPRVLELVVREPGVQAAGRAAEPCHTVRGLIPRGWGKGQTL